MDPTPKRPGSAAGPMRAAPGRPAPKRSWLPAFGLVLVLAGGALPALAETAEDAELAEVGEAGAPVPAR